MQVRNTESHPRVHCVCREGLYGADALYTDCVLHATCLVATESDREDEAVAGPRLKKARRGGRAPRPSDDHLGRKANKRKNSEERGASSGVRTRTPREGALSDDAV